MSATTPTSASVVFMVPSMSQTHTHTSPRAAGRRRRERVTARDPALAAGRMRLAPRRMPQGVTCGLTSPEPRVRGYRTTR